MAKPFPNHPNPRDGFAPLQMECDAPYKEPIFVPKSESAREGEGFLLANVYDGNRKASHLVILDAENVTAGPLATAYLGHRVPFGFHGNWCPAA